VVLLANPTQFVLYILVEPHGVIMLRPRIWVLKSLLSHFVATRLFLVVLMVGATCVVLARAESRDVLLTGTPRNVHVSRYSAHFHLLLVQFETPGERKYRENQSEPQRVYRLDGIRLGATRFEAAVSRGLSAFVGRERELEVLERGLEEARAILSINLARCIV
jgi:hypothetical protein